MFLNMYTEPSRKNITRSLFRKDNTLLTSGTTGGHNRDIPQTMKLLWTRLARSPEKVQWALENPAGHMGWREGTEH